MLKTNAREEEFDLMEVFGKIVLFVECRLDRDTIPENLYVYEVRYNDSGDFYSVENNVVVNFHGTIISKDPIDVPEDGRVAGNDDYGYLDPNWTLDRYVNSDFSTMNFDELY